MSGIHLQSVEELRARLWQANVTPGQFSSLDRVGVLVGRARF